MNWTIVLEILLAFAIGRMAGKLILQLLGWGYQMIKLSSNMIELLCIGLFCFMILVFAGLFQ